MKTIISLVCIVFVTGCFSGNSSVSSSTKFSNSGSLVIARQAPLVFNGERGEALGFMPIVSSGAELLLDNSASTAELRLNGTSVERLNFTTSKSINPGAYSVILKQQNPTWHASDEYFTSRGLLIPSEGSRDRYLKGALGANVIYLSPEIFISDSYYSVPEVGGIVANDREAFARFYAALAVGAKVTVQN